MWLLQKLFTPDTHLPPKVTENGTVKREDKLVEIVTFFEKNNIPTFITQGTCLGAVREGKLIEYDHDIDIAFYEDDAQRIKDLLPKLNELGFYIEEVTPPNLRLRIKDCTSTMDLWILHRPNFFYRLLGNKWWVNNGLFKHDYFDKTTHNTVTIYNKTFRIPKDEEVYLVEHYGATWRTPHRNHNAIYRGYLSQLLNKLTVNSPMPAKFSGVDHMCTWKPWISWILRTFFPKAKLTHLYKHPSV